MQTGAGADTAEIIRSLDLASIVRSYVVRFGSPLFANDGVFFAVERAHDVVVFSDATPNAALSPSLLGALVAKQRIFIASTWMPPTPWRRKLLGIFPGLAVRDGIYPISQLEQARQKWVINPVRDPGEIHHGL